jgi:glycosyltransferase involved in cell wall biosynthesis
MLKLSVLISLYNNENPVFLEKCLESLQKQTRLANEVVMVFDGPISLILETIVNAYVETLNIKVIKLSINSGLAIALNRGLECCTGELIARMDTDDYCYPERLSIQEDFMQNNPDVSILGSAATIVDFQGNIQGIKTNPSNNQDIYQNLWCNPIIHPSVMFRREIIKKLSGYKEELRRRQDYELWFRAAKEKVIFHNLSSPLIYYRFDSESLKKQNPKLSFDQGLIGFRGTLGANLSIVKACLCFYPFIRSLLPRKLQHFVSGLLKCFDPRSKL